MHLLAAQPGGFVDDEGIIDLQQSPADIVILSAADSALAALANSAESLPENFPSIRLANWMQLIKPAAFDLHEDKVLQNTKIVVLSLLGGVNYWQYGFERLVAWSEARPDRILIIVPGDDTPDESLFSASNVNESEAVLVWRFLREGGAINNQQLFNFLASNYLHYDCLWHNPEVLPHCMLYMPQSKLKHSQACFIDWQKRWEKSTTNNSRVCAILFYRSHLQSANTAMFDGLIDVLESQGLQPLPIAIASLKDPESLVLVNALIEQADAKLIINTTGFASNTVSAPDLSSQPSTFQSPFTKSIPVLQLVLSSSTEEDWQSSSQGLRSRDIAMQIVLPEMDGRIVTRAISFKSEAYYCERCEISVVRYALHQERATFVAKLAARYCELSTKTNSEKRIALILANYPTKDGRIGNGVGLDTPESTINILRALAEDNYPVVDIPENGTALIEALLESVTNNPNTLHNLPCWQSISMDDYWSGFKQLPQSCQEAVITQWGQPQDDPKCRNNRIMLAGIRLGETFIGIQPARGFNMDLLANYHDPDLIPPHSYLAFYFWLRHCYQVDAVIHVGKHGNLEWLPGKGSALSENCWPDIALGPMPHFYPFIVNDPGEGAQAKRRSQAVIIDHLMPPMTRAEVYGELAELEILVDEYYQAMGMDIRREEWLREKILLQVKSTNVMQELACSQNTDNAEDQEVLSELDTYLCDIKEAQIRHGLHILGALPKTLKLSDTIVALLRLPRGSEPEAQGILHNIANDLNLRHKGERFDPLAIKGETWEGEKPLALCDLALSGVGGVCETGEANENDEVQNSDTNKSPWRTDADARELLEKIAMQWIEAYVLKEAEITPQFRQDFPASYAQLIYARSILVPALNKSAEQEIQALVSGLNGKFIEPGPSGAPTRGRLDTLPTGRNFYSVDNRSIPSQAAWALGQLSAQALIERHLQEHGDYPKQLGLSVWGTATMRTGGDDIAQAFALMGIKPVWATGSQRVIDFEIIPCMLLNRPRVDVTLRVSGFFRDAFPNVMKLYDAAVLAIAKYDDPGGMNTIKNNINARVESLVAEGLDHDSAQRQASYRVFGSKPGAYGAGLQGLIDERCWETRDDLAEAYLNWGGYAYGDHGHTYDDADSDGSRNNNSDNKSGTTLADSDGIEAQQAFKHQLGQLEAVVQNQDNREHDLLDSDDYYQFQGGMANAVTAFSGAEPVIYHNDHSNPSAPKIRTLKEELNRVIRSRVLNPKWIKGMQEHGYKGAFEMAATVDYLFAYDATTNLIDDYQYQNVADALIFDENNQAFMQANNPSALEEMAERLLEATQRGLWQEPGDYADKLQDLLLAIDAQQEGAGS